MNADGGCIVGTQVRRPTTALWCTKEYLRLEVEGVSMSAAQTPAVGASTAADAAYAVGIQLLADVLLVVAALLLIGLVRHITGGRHLRTFLDIPATQKGALRIYVSSMFVKASDPSATIGLNPVRVGFTGYALTEAEYSAGLSLARAFRVPSVGRLFSTLGNFVADRPLDTLGDVVIAGSPGYVVATPRGAEVLPPESEVRKLLEKDAIVIAIGSPLYNSVTDFLTHNMGPESRVRFCRPSDPGPDQIGYTLEVRPFGPDGGYGSFTRYRIADLQSPHHQSFVEYSVVQRISRRQSGRPPIFICAGTSTAATVAAVSRLSKWKELHRDFANDSFCMVLEVTVRDRESTEEFAQSDIQLIQTRWQYP